MRRTLDLALALAFVLALVAPAIDSVVSSRALESIRREERVPAPPPKWPTTGREFAGTARVVESWFGDRLGFRDRLLRGRAVLLGMLFDVSPTPRMDFGRDRWLFLTALDSIEIARGLKPFSNDELKAWKRSLESRQQWCASEGIEFYVAFAPEKGEIYPDKLAPRHEVVGPTRLAQLTEYLRNESNLEIIDLCAALRSERGRDFEFSAVGDFAYPPHGTHWSDRAMYGVYRAILEALAPRFPALVPLERSAIHYGAASPGETWDRRLFLEDWLVQEERLFVRADGAPYRIISGAHEPATDLVTEIDDPLLPRIVVCHDSFGDPLRRILAHHFAHAAFIWGNNFEPHRILEHRAAAMLQLHTARVLALGVPAPFSSGTDAESWRAFEASSDVLLRVDVLTEPRTLRPHGKIALEHVATGLQVKNSSPFDGLEVPAFVARPGSYPGVRVAVTSEGVSTIDVFYQTSSEREFNRKHVCRLPLKPGRNDLVVEILDPAREGPLLMRLGSEVGACVLHDFEIRAMPR